MNYPVWDVAIIGSGWVIGIIAIIHVMISHFAVGAGFYLPIAEAKARKEGRNDWLDILYSHSRFFLIVTAVFGVVTGVAIWFSIGLVNPEGTSSLIHNFVFGWAMEWVFFLLEVTALAVYYYTWKKLDSKKHLMIGWIYAIAAWMSLVIINGILTFMLTPGEKWLSVAGTGQEASAFWAAFFNPTYWPSLLLRTIICITLAVIWLLITASRIDGDKQPELKTSLIRWSNQWLLPAFILLPFAFVWYILMIPDSSKAFFQIGVSTIGAGVFSQVTRNAIAIIVASIAVFIVTWAFTWKQPKEFKLWQALVIMVLALMTTGFTEHTREMIRKPYVINHYLYSNGIRVNQVDSYNRLGYLPTCIWVRNDEKLQWERATRYAQRFEISDITTYPVSEKDHPIYLTMGEMMFRGQCMACHTRDGYRGMKKLLAERNREAIANMLKLLHEVPEDSPYKAFMPPLVGKPHEMVALIEYLDMLAGNPYVPMVTPPPVPIDTQTTQQMLEGVSADTVHLQSGQ